MVNIEGTENYFIFLMLGYDWVREKILIKSKTWSICMLWRCQGRRKAKDTEWG